MQILCAGRGCNSTTKFKYWPRCKNREFLGFDFIHTWRTLDSNSLSSSLWIIATLKAKITTDSLSRSQAHSTTVQGWCSRYERNYHKNSRDAKSGAFEKHLTLCNYGGRLLIYVARLHVGRLEGLVRPKGLS